MKGRQGALLFSGSTTAQAPSGKCQICLRHWPEAASQTRRVLSELEEAMREPSGDQAQKFTEFEWPERVRRDWPVAPSQMRRVLSELAETMREPSGDQAQVITRL